MSVSRRIPTPDIYKTYRDLRAKCQTYLDMVSDFQNVMPDGILKGPHAALNTQLSSISREAILSYMNNPTPKNWNNICTIMIRPGKNLWEAWSDVDPKALEDLEDPDKWPVIPHPDKLRQAIVSHMDEEYSRCKEALIEARNKIDEIEAEYHIPPEAKLLARANEQFEFHP